MRWTMVLLYVYGIKLIVGVEVRPAPITQLQLVNTKTTQVNSKIDNTTSLSASLLAKTTAANPTSLNKLVGSRLANPADLKDNLATLTTPKINLPSLTDVKTNSTLKVPCTCGVFLSGQFVAGSGKEPEGSPPLIQEYDTPMACTPAGHRQCANKCLEVIAKHLRNSATIICGSLDRDCFKERAYLWTKNCNDVWENSHMSAGREYCCKDGLPYKCSTGKL